MNIRFANGKVKAYLHEKTISGMVNYKAPLHEISIFWRVKYKAHLHEKTISQMVKYKAQPACKIDFTNGEVQGPPAW